MKGEVQKFNNLSKSNTLTIFYKQVPMAQFIALSKKIKKADQIELANMYNEKQNPCQIRRSDKRRQNDHAPVNGVI